MGPLQVKTRNLPYRGRRQERPKLQTSQKIRTCENAKFLLPSLSPCPPPSYPVSFLDPCLGLCRLSCEQGAQTRRGAGGGAQRKGSFFLIPTEVPERLTMVPLGAVTGSGVGDVTDAHDSLASGHSEGTAWWFSYPCPTPKGLEKGIFP